MAKASPSGHGGARPGAGRKTGTGRFREPTQVMRVPESLVPAVRGWLDRVSESPGGKMKAFSKQPMPLSLPLFSARISAGFPSPADDHMDGRIDLNQQLVQHPAATFFVRVQGDSMTGAGIYNGDLLIVDRALEAKSGTIVVAVVNGELTVKRLLLTGKRIRLMPENPAYPPSEIGEGLELVIWGVVAHTVRSF